jgi:hypothetical protein
MSRKTRRRAHGIGEHFPRKGAGDLAQRTCPQSDTTQGHLNALTSAAASASRAASLERAASAGDKTEIRLIPLQWTAEQCRAKVAELMDAARRATSISVASGSGAGECFGEVVSWAAHWLLSRPSRL